ncbi:NADP-binding protein [Billgrantia kenyensis]|uniref:NADP-binding protein n=1 Tax=Billgrantia kenyensis TaxID=321266 RepID=A0A7V9VZV1_9GAMM|nr:NADP-binding protein [Halomonas kenyensis]MBA2778430.1 NADP-binding protein [Halomonas kenyensis]MCG6660736.1 NADP-binding protein [Halomonas kenyensis]
MRNDLILCGVGAMGQRIARLALARDYPIRAVVDRDPAKAGIALHELLDIPEPEQPVIITPDLNLALQGEKATVMHATGSFLTDVAPMLRDCLEKGHDVISIAEEMIYPMAADRKLASELDELARLHGARLLGTGVNPGFAMDVLLLALTVPCGQVGHLYARRCNDLSDFGATVLDSQGVGLTIQAFERAVAAGEVVGHVGFRQSICLMAAQLGWPVDRIEEHKVPIVTRVARSTPHVSVAPGEVAGCHHEAVAYCGDREVIRLEHPQQIRPELEGIETSDFARISGDQAIEMRISPEVGGGAGTAACAVNAIAYLPLARPGLVHLNELPLTAPRFAQSPLD